MKKLIFFLIIDVAFNNIILSQESRKHMTINPSSGYANIHEITCGYGLGNRTMPNSNYFYGLMTTHCYHLDIYGLNIKNTLSGGIGTGMLIYNEGYLFPLYIDLRFSWNKRNISPYLFGTNGILFDFEDLNYNSKIFVNGGGGIMIKINENLNTTFGTGLLVQMGSTNRDSFLNIKAGLVFKPK